MITDRTNRKRSALRQRISTNDSLSRRLGAFSGEDVNNSNAWSYSDSNPLLTPRQMSFLLHRERARAHRSHREFSLVLFRISRIAKPTFGTLRLIRIIMGRARLTDDIGWFNDHFLGVLLPGTDGTGAWRFAESIRSQCVNRSARPICAVYTYPSKWFDPIDEHDDHDHNGSNGSSNGNGSSSNGNGSSHEHARQLSAANGNGNGNGNGDAESHPNGLPVGHLEKGDLLRYVLAGMQPGLGQHLPPVAPMENLFVNPLPRWKRIVDIIGASFGLLLASPIMLVIAALIKLTSKGPIFFAQQRSGLGGKQFAIYKFRTMIHGAEDKRQELAQLSEQDGPAFKIKHDPRVTKLGYILRRTSLDELPQLWNVLIGDMSLVGPRPLPVFESDACDLWHRQRLDVTPGLTCIWQVRGRSRVTFAEWMRMDLEYIRKRSPMYDAKLLVQTVPAVLFGRGAV